MRVPGRPKARAPGSCSFDAAAVCTFGRLRSDAGRDRGQGERRVRGCRPSASVEGLDGWLGMQSAAEEEGGAGLPGEDGEGRRQKGEQAGSRPRADEGAPHAALGRGLDASHRIGQWCAALAWMRGESRRVTRRTGKARRADRWMWAEAEGVACGRGTERELGFRKILYGGRDLWANNGSVCFFVLG
jgi:hypothetical protein